MKTSVFTVSMPEYNIRDTVKVLKELGYDGVEWRIHNPPPAEKPDDLKFELRYWNYNLSTIDVNTVDSTAKDVMEICNEFGIEVSSLSTYLDVSEKEKIEKVMKAAKIMICRNIRIGNIHYNEKENYRSQFDKAIIQAKEIEKLAMKYDVRAMYEIHMGTIHPSASAAYRLVSNLDPKYAGVILDPGNMVGEGYENFRIGIELLGEYLAHVHIKNGMLKYAETTKDGVDIWNYSAAPFKKGSANLTEMLKVLKDVGYNGYISVEDFSNEEDTYNKLKSNIEFIRKF